MSIKYTIHTLLFCLLCFVAVPRLAAQNISGEVIQVSAVSLTLVKFNAPVTQYDFGVRNNYTCQLRDKDRSIIIKTIGDKPVSTNLFVTEGKRAHFFVIQFLPKIDINKDKLSYDFSDLKYVKQLASNKGTEPAANETASKKEEDKPKKLSKAEKKEVERKEKERLQMEEEAKQQEAVAKKREEDSAAQAQTIMIAAKVSAESKKKKEEEAALQYKAAQAELAKAQEAQKLAEAKLLEAQKQAKLQKAAEDLKAAQEAVLAKKAEEAEKAKQLQAEKAAKLQKEADDKKATAAAAAILAQQKAEENQLAKLAKTEEQRKQLEKAKQEADEKRKVADAKAAEIKLAQEQKRAEEAEKAKQAALAAKAAREAKEQEVKAAREAEIARQQKLIEDQKAAVAAAQAAKLKKEQEAKAAVEAKRLQDEQLAKEKALALEVAKKEKKRIADSLATLPKTYSNAELFKKYPKFLFGAPPAGQTLSPYFGDPSTADDSATGKTVLASKPELDLHSDTSHGAYFILEDIKFGGLNCYLKLRIKNTATTDYLVGPINFVWYRNADSITYKLNPIYVSQYPILAPKTERTIIYTMPAANVFKDDQLILTIGDRLKVVSLGLDIPTNVYINQSQKSK